MTPCFKIISNLEKKFLENLIKLLIFVKTNIMEIKKIDKIIEICGYIFVISIFLYMIYSAIVFYAW